MSASIVENVIVDVTRGDCVNGNRKGGKSNTGTYFLCSCKDFDKFQDYFSDDNIYKFDIEKIMIYKSIFNEFCKDKKEDYPDKMRTFDASCNFILSQDDTTVKMHLRINDSRVFIRFSDNNIPIVKSFRHLLYEDISKIVFEKKNGYIAVYPCVYCIELKQVDFNDDLVFDDDESID